jgi:hypothetical protein
VLHKTVETPQFLCCVKKWCTHNMHIWATENPHATRHSLLQHRCSVNIWAGIVDDYVIGPYAIGAISLK